MLTLFWLYKCYLLLSHVGYLIIFPENTLISLALINAPFLFKFRLFLYAHTHSNEVMNHTECIHSHKTKVMRKN